MVNNGLNYFTNYYYQINEDPIKIINHVCFSELYRKTYNELNENNVNKGKIGIKVYFSSDLNRNLVDNYCLLNENELNQYIEWLKNITKFNIKISNKIPIDDWCNDANYKIITAKFTKRYPYEIRLICALIRNLYECPYNIMVKAAFLMESLQEFGGLDFTERFCVAVDSIKGYSTGHSTFGSSGIDLYNNKSIRKRYIQAVKEEMNVEGFMLKRSGLEFARYSYYNTLNEDTDENIFDSLEEDYISDELKKILIKNYKIIKNNGR